MTMNDFEHLVADALDSLPEEFGSKLENVHVLAQQWPTPADLRAGNVPIGSTLLGLYIGVPRTKRGHYHGVLPDKIIIFASPIIALAGHDPKRIRDQVRRTLLHEIGHHFGMSEEEIRRAQH